MAELGRALAGWLLSHGTHEDACSTSLDSKWFSRTSDPLGPPELAPESPRVSSSSFAPKLTHDSHTSGTGVDSRGPFTATIRPKSSGRKRALGALAAACALLGGLVAVFASTQKGRIETPAARPAVAARPSESSSAVRAVAPMQSALTLAAAANDATDEPHALTEPTTERLSASSIGQARPAVSATHLARTTNLVNTGIKTMTSARRTAPPPSAPSPRELDLISPY